MRRLCFWLPVVLCLYLVVGPRAGAQGILVSPARIEALLAHDGMLPPVWVENRTELPVRFWVETGWVTHDMHGRPVYLPSERRGDVTVHVLPAAGVLTPGQGVHLDIRVEPADRPVYPVVYLLFQQAEGGDDILRVAVPLLLHTGLETPRTMIEGVSIESHDDANRLHLLVANYGEAHVRVGGRVRILGTSGEAVAESHVPEALVLPGARRLITVEWDGSPLAWGEYRIVFADGEFSAGTISPLRIVLGPDGVRQIPADVLAQIAQSEPVP